jgi:hypothetical protein
MTLAYHTIMTINERNRTGDLTMTTYNRTPAQIEDARQIERQNRREARRRHADRVDSCILPVLVATPIIGLIGMASPLCALAAVAVGVVAIACYLCIE